MKWKGQRGENNEGKRGEWKAGQVGASGYSLASRNRCPIPLFRGQFELMPLLYQFIPLPLDLHMEWCRVLCPFKHCFNCTKWGYWLLVFLPLMDLRVRFNWSDVLKACIFIVVSVVVLYLWFYRVRFRKILPWHCKVFHHLRGAEQHVSASGVIFYDRHTHPVLSGEPALLIPLKQTFLLSLK